MKNPDSKWFRLQQLQARVQEWRDTRQKHSPMPAELWREATALGCELGVNVVRLAAQIDYGALKKRVASAQRSEPTRASVEAHRGVPQRGVQFLELGTVLGTSSAQTVVELTDATGMRLTIHFPSETGLDIAAVVGAFRGSTR
jgi:hypothetical protein